MSNKVFFPHRGDKISVTAAMQHTSFDVCVIYVYVFFYTESEQLIRANDKRSSYQTHTYTHIHMYIHTYRDSKIPMASMTKLLPKYLL